MKFENLGVKDGVDSWWQIFCRFSPQKIGLKFVTANFTTFFTAIKEICHLEFTLGAPLPNDFRQGRPQRVCCTECRETLS